MIRVIIWFNALLNSDAIQNKMKRQVVKNLSLFILFIDNIQGCGNMDEEVYIDDIYELKDLLGNNFDKCLEGIDKDSDISKYFSEEYLKNYFSKKDENNEDADIDLYVYNLIEDTDFLFTCEENIGVYIEDFEVSENLPEDILTELSDRKGYYQNYLKYKDKYYPDTIEYMEDLKNKKDNIGDSTFLTYKLDYNNRENPFVYVDGKIYIGKNFETHTQLIKRVFLKQGYDNDKDIQRIDNDTMEKDVGSDVFAFGHIAMNMAFIDDNLSNCTREEVADAIKSQTNVNKVYYYDCHDKQVTRLAKLKYMEG